MVSGTRVLSPGHARRARICDSTRATRREFARNRVRRPLQDIGNLTNVRVLCNRVDNEEINNECIHLQGLENNVVDNNSNHFEPIGQNGFENDVLHEEVDTNVLDAMNIDYPHGDYTKVEKRCLSVTHMYIEQSNIITSCFFPLRSGKCLKHNLGGLDYVCRKCRALCWKSEVSGNDEVIGKYCCGQGAVVLQPLLDPPEELRHLMHDQSTLSKEFLKNIRAYNSALAFASLGAHVDERFSRGRGVYTFRVHGQIYHNIGPLMPNLEDDLQPRFAQLYFYDTEHELLNRLRQVSNIQQSTLSSLQGMMHRCNPYAQVFRSAGQMMQSSNPRAISMLISERRSNGWQYLAPRGTEVAAIMPGQGDEHTVGHRDILINLRDGGLKRISNIHRSYMPLVYVLLFPRGEDGWDPSSRLTQKQYYTYRLQIRGDTIKCLLRGSRLLQQYIVDAFSSMEESRLLWVRNNQRTIRSEIYKGLVDMVEARDSTEQVDGRHAGRRVILPSSFTGGPRYMHQLYQDSMAIVRKRGKPDLFITFTCNPRWAEIQDALLPGQDTSDRPDVVSRVFYEKFVDMMHLLTKTAVFGDVAGYVSVIEFQKRGLPHAHILLILTGRHKPTELNDYDRLVCAEFPDKQLFPELYDIICRCNVHGPCGQYYNPNSPCMIEGKCRFKYPRRFSASTTLDENGYPTYMRRDDGKYIMAKDKKLDNRWIVPYNPFLSMRYKAHINVEICSTITAVKYLYKYIYKGHDRATIVMQDDDAQVDEIKSYLDARYVSSSEAVWRIYGFDLHREKPNVQRLQVHLPKENPVAFRDSDNLREVVENEANKRTTLTEWFVANETHASANDLLYIDFPERWVWNKRQKIWTERQKQESIGRMYNIVPTAGDLYFLRMLLTVCRGCKSFEDLRTVNGCTYPTFKDACNARGMLQSDEEWMVCLEEASYIRSGVQLRELFAIILIYCMPVAPERLWDRFCKEFSDDYLHILRNRGGCDVNICVNIAKNQALANLDSLLKVYGKTLCDFPGMPQVDRAQLHGLGNTMLAEETMFDLVEQENISLQMESALNQGQRYAYWRVLHAIQHNRASVFFLDGPGGSGKTFLYNALLSRIRGEQKIALACASSGIAALLLSNGRTAHSRLKIPIDLNNESTCNIKVTSNHADLLRQASLIIWDEAPMTHRHAFEAVDRTLRDIMHTDSLFGGKIMLLGGDFRQVLPVVPKGRREDIVDASLCHSFIWRHIEILRLTENMRLLNSTTDENERDFARWVLNIGNDSLEVNSTINDEIVLPHSMLLEGNNMQSLIDYIYVDMETTNNYAEFFKERAILAPKNKDVDAINSLALHKLGGVTKEYLSADSMCSSDDHSFQLYTLEFLNSLDLGGGYPAHVLTLKVNAPVMLLRNLDPRRGLCNGTRLICKELYERVIDAEIITGKNAGDRVLIPRIDFISPSSLGLPFEMRRRQFPLKLAFGMTINKSQGQTLGILGLYLVSPVFSHGQLYVAMSRVRSSNAIKIVVDDRKLYKQENTSRVSARTPNIVFKEVLQLAYA